MQIAVTNFQFSIFNFQFKNLINESLLSYADLSDDVTYIGS